MVEKELYSLREKGSHKLLNVAMSEQSLKYTTYKDRFIYFNNPKREIINGKLVLSGNVNTKVYVDKYRPIRHTDEECIKQEKLYKYKAKFLNR